MKKIIVFVLLLFNSFTLFGYLIERYSPEKRSGIVSEIKKDRYEPSLGKLMNQTEIIQDLSMKENISYREAELKLFPTIGNLEEESEILGSEKQFRIISETPKEKEDVSNDLNDLGKLYFYTLTTSGQNFRAIKQILYVIYIPNDGVFSGILHYCLTDSNRVHYTLNGALFDNDTFTISGVGKAKLYKATFLNYAVPPESSYNKPVFIDKDRCY